MQRVGFLSACVLAALAPLLQRPLAPAARADFPGWPRQLDGRVLQPLNMTDAERRFARDFPGRIGTFADGRRHVILRFVTRRTRRLHPAADCYRGLGYQVEPLPSHTDEQGRVWSALRATRGERVLRVREHIHGADGAWSDVSSWYWAALMKRTAGPWWATTVVSVEPGGN